MSADQTHVYMEELLQEEAYYPAHLNIIRLGREICHARKPNCSQCPLNDMCDFYAGLNINEKQVP
jgi:endonuclease-3